MISKKCKAHLKEVDETALQHMFYALKVALTLQLLVPALIIHSIAPSCLLYTSDAADE